MSSEMATQMTSFARQQRRFNSTLFLVRVVETVKAKMSTCENLQ